MEQAALDQIRQMIEEELTKRFPGSAVERVAVLQYGDDPEIEPGELAVRIFLKRRRVRRPRSRLWTNSIKPTVRRSNSSGKISQPGFLRPPGWSSWLAKIPRTAAATARGSCWPGLATTWRRAHLRVATSPR